MTTDQVPFGVGLILVLAVSSQVPASRLRIPALRDNPRFCAGIDATGVVSRGDYS